MSREAALEQMKSGDPHRAASALIAVSLYEERAFAGALVESSLSDPDPVVRAAAAMGAGHVARIHRAVSGGIHSALRTLVSDPDSRVAGAAGNALDDIEIFVRIQLT